MSEKRGPIIPTGGGMGLLPSHVKCVSLDDPLLSVEIAVRDAADFRRVVRELRPIMQREQARCAKVLDCSLVGSPEFTQDYVEHVYGRTNDLIETFIGACCVTGAQEDNGGYKRRRRDFYGKKADLFLLAWLPRSESYRREHGEDLSPAHHVPCELLQTPGRMGFQRVERRPEGDAWAEAKNTCAAPASSPPKELQQKEGAGGSEADRDERAFSLDYPKTAANTKGRREDWR